jgi:glutamate carboxypeptidase
MHSLLASAESHRAWIERLVLDLVQLESPSTDKAALDRCGDELARRLEALGARVTRHPQSSAGDHLKAEFGDRQSQVLILGHFDTVWPTGELQRMPCERRADRISGPGAFDMKAGIAIAMLAARLLSERADPTPHRVVMLWTTDEEIGSATSRALLEEEARRSRAVFVLEPSLPGGALKTARKGVGDFSVAAEGVAAHAGIDPASGASAVHELARQALRLLELHEPDRGVTVNVGRFVGGDRTNVVADRAVMNVDVRVPTMADGARIAAAFASLTPQDARVRLAVTGGIDRPPLERSAAVAALYEQARDIARALGRSLGEGATGGGSDGNFTAALGIPTLDGLGADGGGAHSRDEHVLVESLPFRAALLAGLILTVE